MSNIILIVCVLLAIIPPIYAGRIVWKNLRPQQTHTFRSKPKVKPKQELTKKDNNYPEPASGTWVYTTKKGVVWIDHGKGKDLFAGRRMPASKLERWTPFLFLIGTALFFATLVWLLNKLP